MSHALRIAVAATSLFACPACATTGSLDRPLADQIETEHATRGAAASAAAPPPATGAVSRAASVAPDTPLATPYADGAAALLAWERSRAPGGAGGRNWTALTSEPTDSRLRLVLPLLSPMSGATTDSIAGSAEMEPAALWSAAPAPAWPEVLGLKHELVSLAGPLGTGADAPVLTAPRPHDAPEPGTLALAVLGLSALGLGRRLRRLDGRLA